MTDEEASVARSVGLLLTGHGAGSRPEGWGPLNSKRSKHA